MRPIIDWNQEVRKYPLIMWHYPISHEIGLFNEFVNGLFQNLLTKKTDLENYMRFRPSPDEIANDGEYMENECIYVLFDDFVMMEMNYQIPVLYHYFENKFKAHFKIVKHVPKNLIGFNMINSINEDNQDKWYDAVINNYKQSIIDITQMKTYKDIEELRLLANCIKHNDSMPSDKLTHYPYNYQVSNKITISLEKYGEFSTSITSFFGELYEASKKLYVSKN